MKKTYLSPAIETTKMRLAFGICEVTQGDKAQEEPEVDPFIPPVPGRRKPF